MDISPESPEARRRRAATAARERLNRGLDRIRPGTRIFEVIRRVAIGAYSDGFIHAGNLAYLALLTLFPFFIVAAAIARMLGRTEDGLNAVRTFIQMLPPSVAEVLATPINDVLAARSGSLLWLGALVGLWTTTSFIETIRDILRRAYGTTYGRPFWEYRLGAIGLIIGSVLLLMTAFSLQVILLGIEQFLHEILPFMDVTSRWISVSRLAPPIILYGALYMLFYTLTPHDYRGGSSPKWPGPAFVTLWWTAMTALLPVALRQFGGYGLTYGSLAGVVIALLFFFVVGLGMVIGAELNAALAETPEGDLKEIEITQK